MTFIYRRQALALASALIACVSLGASAQTSFPTQAIKIIVPFTPGTGMDTIARVVAPRLSERPVPAATLGPRPWPNPRQTDTPC